VIFQSPYNVAGRSYCAGIKLRRYLPGELNAPSKKTGSFSSCSSPPPHPPSLPGGTARLQPVRHNSSLPADVPAACVSALTFPPGINLSFILSNSAGHAALLESINGRKREIPRARSPLHPRSHPSCPAGCAICGRCSRGLARQMAVPKIKSSERYATILRMNYTGYINYVNFGLRLFVHKLLLP